jgi:hypothetical protein
MAKSEELRAQLQKLREESRRLIRNYDRVTVEHQRVLRELHWREGKHPRLIVVPLPKK